MSVDLSVYDRVFKTQNKTKHSSKFSNREEHLDRREMKARTKLIRNMRIDKAFEQSFHLKAQSLFGFDLHLKPDFSSFHEFVDLTIDKLKIFSDSIDWKQLIVSFLLCLSSVWCNWDRPATIFMAISQFIMNLRLADVIVTQALDWFINLYGIAKQAIDKIFNSFKDNVMSRFTGNTVNRLKAQMDLPFEIDIAPLIPVMGGAATSLFTLAILRKMPGGDKFDTTLNRFSKMSGIIRSYADLENLGSNFFSRVWDSIAYYVFGVEKPVMDEWKNINLWVDEVTSLIVPDFETTIRNNESMKNQVESLLQRGLNILRILDMLKVPMTERQTITSCMMFLYRARETAASCGAGQTKPRVAPAIIHFYGDSGVGKSTTLWALIAEIQASLGVKSASDLHEKTYFRRPGGKFWDGYSNGMNVVVCDDFGAIADSKQAPNEEFLEAIHMSNTAFWQLNMADLKDKGNTFFQAKCVLWTSNKSRFDVQSLTNPEAVLRRVDLKIRQKPHPNFAKTDMQNGRHVQILDNNKVNQAIREYGDEAMLQCILFDIVDKHCPNDTVLTPNLSFWEVAELCVGTVKRNLDYFNNFNDVLSSHVQKAIDRSVNGWIKGEKTFDPNSFVVSKRVEAQGVFDTLTSNSFFGAAVDQSFNVLDVANKMSSSVSVKISDVSNDVNHQVRKTLSLANVHTGTYNAENITVIQDLSMGYMSQSDEARLMFLKGMSEQNQCFVINPKDANDFMSCMISANEAMQWQFEVDQTDEVFRNLFHQAELQFGKQFPIDELERCNVCFSKSKIISIKEAIVGSKSKLDNFIFNKFGISPSTFYMITVVGTTLLGLCGVYLYKTIYSRVETLSFENYTFDKVKGKARKLVSENTYNKEVVGRKSKVVHETYAEKPKSVQKKTIAEQYQQEVKGKKVKTVAEGCSGCIGCGKDNDPPICSSDNRNILEKSCDYLASYIPDGPFARKRCIHGNVCGLCYYCQNDMKFESHPQFQAVVDQNAAEVVSNVYRNMYKLEYFTGDRWQHAMNLIIVKGRFAILNRHVLSFMDYDQWRIRNNSFADGIEFNLGSCSMFYAEDDTSSPYGFRDVMMIELPTEVHQHKDIVKKFMDGDDFARFTQLQQVSLIGFVPSEKVVLRQYFGSDVEADDSTFQIEHPNSDEVLVTVRSLIKYNIQTTGGDCGAVLVAFDKNFSNKIFGIHCAGISDARFQGFGTPVSQGMINYFLKNIGAYEVSSHMSPNFESFNDVMSFTVQNNGTNCDWSPAKTLVGNFYPIGKDAQPLFQGTVTKIVPSPVHGVVQVPTMAPAVLKKTVIDGKVVDPMANARIKASPISKPVDNDLLDECCYNFYQMINVSKVDKKLLSYEESISGIEGDICYPPMKRSTSPGYGWQKVGVGKTKWLGADEYIYDDVELKSRYEVILDMCKRGERPNTIWSDTLKDERRTLDKVAVAKTRLFSCGEMAYTLLFRQYFAGFIAHMTRHKINVESCVGTNVYSMDWTKIAKKLKEVGNNVIAGDFTNYDGTLHPTLLWKIVTLINNWYDDGEENALVRVALWSEIVNSIHIVDDTFYMWNHSQPSGCPMTTILNCTYHSISARFVYMVCAKKYCPSLASLEYFSKYIRHVNYGDDDVWSIHSDIVDWFNQITISDAYVSLGMKYTDETKSGTLVPFRTLETVNFLKREFRWDTTQARYRAPLALATILEMPMWNHGTVDQYPLTASILQDAARELAQHDRETFDEHFPKLERGAEIVRKKSPVCFKTYNQYQFEEIQKILDDTN